MTDPTSGVDERAILECFTDPPRSEADLRARIAGIDPAAGRRIILDRLARSGAPPRESAMIVSLLSVFGVGEGDVAALGELCANDRAVCSGRAVGLAVLSAIDPGSAAQIARRLSPDELLAINDAQLTSVIASMPATPARVTEITQKLLRQPEGARTIRLGQIERIRRRLGIPAALLYRDAIGREDLGLAAPIVDLLVEEGGAAASILLERLAATSASPEATARWTAAIARLYQAARRPAVEVPRIEAWRAESEQGAIEVAIALESAVDGSLTIATASIAAGSAAIAEGSAVSLAPRRTLDEALGALGAQAEIGIAAAAAEVEAAAQKTYARAGEADLSGGIFAAISYFSLAGGLAAR